MYYQKPYRWDGSELDVARKGPRFESPGGRSFLFIFYIINIWNYTNKYSFVSIYIQ